VPPTGDPLNTAGGFLKQKKPSFFDGKYLLETKKEEKEKEKKKHLFLRGYCP
jgi:hypothetical protein